MSGRVVVLVDDDEEFRDSCEAVLALSGWKVLAFSNGREALTYLRGDGPPTALILLDLMMHDMDGWAFREEQLRDPRLAPIPCVVMSASGTAPPEGVPATSFLSKLVEPKDLLATVERAQRSFSA